MDKIKVLVLYGGLSGESKEWDRQKIDLTIVEINESLCRILQEWYPEAHIICADAREYLLHNYKEFDFIWSSKPCTTHSKVRIMAVRKGDYAAVYPDMGLYEEILFLKHHFKGKWVVENVVPYYEPLIQPTVKLDRHLFWSNFQISHKEFPSFARGKIRKGLAKELQELKGINLDSYRIIGRRKDSILRSYVDPRIGKHIFECAFKKSQNTLLEV